MSLPARTTLTAAIQALIEAITQANGARLDLAGTVHVGLYQVNEGEAPCIVLAPGNEVPAPQSGHNAAVTVQYTMSAYVSRSGTTADEYTADPTAEFAIVDAVIADLRDAVEGNHCTLPAESVQYQGAVPKYHEAGGDLCGAELRYLVSTPRVDDIPGN